MLLLQSGLRMLFKLCESLEEIGKRSYEIFIEIKLIMVHILWHLQERLSLTVLVQLLRVIHWNKCVFLAMQEENRTLYFLNVIYVPKAFINHG